MVRLGSRARAVAERAASRVTGFRLLRLAVACVLVGVFLRDVFPNPSYRPAGGDLVYFQFLWEVGRTIWGTFHQMPFWNPYNCGGMVELANVHSMAWSPFFAPALLFGPGAGIRIFIVTHFLIAFVGTWLWARHRGLADPWAIAPALVFTMSGFLTARSAGHLSFLPFAWIPWMLLLHERAQGERRHAYLIGALMGLLVYSGAPYPMMFSILLVVALTVRDLLPTVVQRLRSGVGSAWQKPLVIAVLAATGFLLVGAFKLFPSMEFMLTFPRGIPKGDDSLGLWNVVEMFLYRPFTRERLGYTYPFDEYRDYVGPFVVGGALLTLLRGRAGWRDVAIAGFFFSLMLGDHGPFSPYALLHHLPGYGSQRVPSRYAILLLPFLGLWFGQSLAALAGDRTASSRWRPVAAGLVLAATFADLATSNTVMLRDWFSTPPELVASPDKSRIDGFSQVSNEQEDWLTVYLRAPLDGYGFSLCTALEPNPVPRAASLLEFTDSQLMTDPIRGNWVRLLRFTPNHLELTVNLVEAGSIVMNQNYYPGWTSEFGPATERAGRLAFALPVGKRTVTLTYRPRFIWFYAGLTLVGLVGGLWALRRAPPIA